MLATVTTVADLAATRQTILYDTATSDEENFEMVTAIEAQISPATFESRADKIAGNKILMESKPSRWDDFQETLFLQMQKFA